MESVLVLATVALVIVGAWYATETRRMVNRMDRDREDRSRPILTFSLIPWHPKVIKLRLQNAGAGPAFHIEGKIHSEGSWGSNGFGWSHACMQSGDFEEWAVPLAPDMDPQQGYQIDAVRQFVSVVKASFTYGSASGSKYSLSEAIDPGRITAEWIQSRMLATRDHPSRLPQRIAEGVESIAKELSRGAAVRIVEVNGMDTSWAEYMAVENEPSIDDTEK